MARYIDADALKERLEDFSKWCRDGRKQGVDFVLDCPLPNMPTADVAPRAEVDELIYKLECLLCHATGGKLSKYTYDLRTMETIVTDYVNESYSEGYDEAKAEVAREILQEVRQALLNMVLANSMGENYDIEKRFAEIEKKYTEPEPPKGDES